MAISSAATNLLGALLPEWHLLLQEWSASGRLTAAAQEALILDGEPQALTDLANQWAAGEFGDLPPIVLLSSADINGALGAYAITTGTIYLNADWLAGASKEEVFAVLTEELGHHLEGVLNGVDTPGDEEEYFSYYLLYPNVPANRDTLNPQENDRILLTQAGIIIEAEASTTNSNSFYSARIGVGYGWGSVSEVLINGQSVKTESQFNGSESAASELAAKINAAFPNLQATIALDSRSTIIVRSTSPGSTFTVSAVRTAGVTVDNLVDDDVVDITLSSSVPSLLDGSNYVVSANDLYGDQENIYAFLGRRWYTVDANGGKTLIQDATGTSASISSKNDVKVQCEVDYIDGELNQRTASSNILLSGLDKGAAQFIVVGNLIVDETVNAVISANDPDGNGTFAYAWQTSSDGTNWTPVGTNSASYTVAAGDEGKQLKLVVSYTDAQGFSESVTTTAGTVPFVDNGDAVFSISGAAAPNAPVVGNILTATNTTADPDGNGTFAYAWQASSDGTNWSNVGTNSSSYTVAAGDEGKQLKLVVSYTDAHGFNESVTTTAGTVPFVDNGDASFSITGTRAVGQILTAAIATADPDGNGSGGFSYTWQSSTDGTTWANVGTNSATYTIAAADEGKQLRLIAFYTDAQNFPETVTTSAGMVENSSFGELPQVAVTASANGNEADGSPVIFSFSRSGSTAEALSIGYQLFGTAQAGSDYTGSTTGTISFAAGSATAILSLPALADGALIDPGETIIARIDPASGYSITTGKETATATITAEGMVVSVNGPTFPGKSNGEWRNQNAFAALKSDGTVISWGNSTSGGTTPAGLNIVAQIFSTGSAFAALKSDGTVVSWGSISGSPSNQSGFIKIFSNSSTFAALKNDGTVVAWGSWGGTAPTGLSDVTQIFSTDTAFAALKSDGTVVAWGHPSYGGTAPTGLSGVTQVFSNQRSFAALKSDGTVVSWGDSGFGGMAPTGLSDVNQIFSAGSAFAALKSDGTVASWGGSLVGMAPTGLSDVTQIFSTVGAFVALRSDGTVISWGGSGYGGTAPTGLSGVTQVFSNQRSFAALKSDGTVVSWGDSDFGGMAPTGLSGVTHIFSTDYAFAALKSDRTVVSWGSSDIFGSSTVAAPSGLSNVTQIFSTGSAFAALKSDGTVVSWGSSSSGGVTPSGVKDVVGFANPYIDDWLLVPSVTLTASRSSVTEDGIYSLIFTFSRTGSTASQLTINYTVAGSATLGVDYTGISAIGTTESITFAEGSATATVTADPTADATSEADETVTLALASGHGYTIGTLTPVTGTITNDDLPVITLSVSPASVTEDGSTNLAYTFSRTGPTTQSLTINYTVDGSATKYSTSNLVYGNEEAPLLGLKFTDYTGIQYLNLPGTVAFASGSSSAVVIVNPTADTLSEHDETVTLTLVASALFGNNRYTVGTASQATGTITDDDYPSITLAVSPASATEDGTENLVFTFTRTGSTTSPLTVNYTVGGTAHLSTDYTGILSTPSTKTVTFAAGSGTATVTVDPTPDTEIEPDETVALTLAEGTGYIIGTTAAVVGTITNNDGAAVFSITGTRAVGQILTAAVATADPDGNGTFSYQWQSSANGTTWGNVGTNSANYTIGAADEGKQLRLIAAYSDAQNFSETVTTAAGTIPFVDSGDAVFSITGTRAVGQTLTVAVATADPDGNGSGGFSYTWQSSSDGTTWGNVGTNSPTYTIAAADEGKQLRLLTGYTDAQNFSETVTTSAGTVAFGDNGDAVFSISGTSAVGNTLSATTTTADPDGNGSGGFTYSWQTSSNGTTWSNVGTNSASYTVASADEGKQLQLVVSYTDAQGFNESVTTTAGTVPFVDDGDAVFSISGAAAPNAPVVGNILTATNTTADPDGNGTFAYAWQASSDGTNWSNVGTNSASYTVASADEGKQLQLVVSYTDAQGFNESVTTTAGTVPFVDNGDAVFSISGTSAVGNTLSATTTTADPDGNGTFTYSWQTSSNGTTWSNVGTNSASYTVASADEGKQIQLVVSYTDAQGFSESVTTSVGFIPYVNDAPTDLTFTTGGIQENSVAGSIIGTLSAIDPDAGSTFSYALVAGNGTNDADNALVEIVSNQVRVKSGAVIDFETNPVLNLNIRVTDNGNPGLTFIKAVSTSVLNLNEALYVLNVKDSTGKEVAGVSSDSKTSTLSLLSSTVPLKVESIKLLERYKVNDPFSGTTKQASNGDAMYMDFTIKTGAFKSLTAEIALDKEVKANAYVKINPNTGEAFDFTFDPITGLGAQLLDNNKNGLVDTLKIYLQDGAKGDVDGLVNGEIRDPGVLADAPRQSVYRFFKASKGVHFYTASDAERANVNANPEWGYKDEGVAYDALVTQGKALHRFFNAKASYHFMTTNDEEAKTVKANPGWGYSYEGQSFNVSTIPQLGMSTPVNRFYRVLDGVGQHFYTASADEASNINAHPEWGYKSEGVGWYV